MTDPDRRRYHQCYLYWDLALCSTGASTCCVCVRPVCGMATEDVRYAFIVEWFDPQASLLKKYNLFFWPATNSIEMVPSRTYPVLGNANAAPDDVHSTT